MADEIDSKTIKQLLFYVFFVLETERMREAASQVDVWHLARTQGKLQGSAALTDFPRLIADLPEQAASTVDWALVGETDIHGRCYLKLQAQASVRLECQRCLALFELPLQVESRLQLAETDAELEDEEEIDDDPDIPDLVLGSTRFDVLSLVEDELILALPYVPKHDVCPSLPKALETDEGSDTGRPSPFAVLAELKKD